MPYTLTDFPLKTNRPRIDVELPVGRYEFELVVTDSAGLQSTPDRIVIEVTQEQAKPPEIEGIDKVFGLPGQVINTAVRGRNLRDATDIRFERVVPREAAQSKEAAPAKPAAQPRSTAPATSNQLDARILPGGTETQLRIALRIPGNAELGEYSFSVTTRAGTAQSKMKFLVTAAPHIDNFGPSRSHLDETTEVTIDGQHLIVPTLEPDYADPQKPLQLHQVQIVAADNPDAGTVPGITVSIIKPRSDPDSVCATIEVSQAAAPGEYRLRLITPAGTTDAEDTFLVERSRGR